MTLDEIIERALRKAGIFPPSVLDAHYGDKAEMSRAEIVVRSLGEMGLLSVSEGDPRFDEKMRRIPIAIERLQLRLPDGEITTCGGFKVLGVGCCNVCHTHPLHRMRLVELPGCTWAWLCCEVDAASSPEQHLVLDERGQDSPRERTRTCRCGKRNRREN